MRTRYRDIAARLRADCARRPPGTQLPAEAELARVQGCSLLTLRRALQLLAETGRVRRLHGRGTFVAAAAADAVTPAPLILYWGQQTGHLYGELFDLLSRRLHQHGYGVLVLNPEAGNAGTRNEEMLLRCLAAQPAAVVVLGAVEISRELLERHRHRLPPLYFILRRDYPFAEQRGEVLVDGTLGGWQVAEHLHGLGHRRACVFIPALADHAPDVRTPVHQLKAGLEAFARRHRDLELRFHPYPRGPLDAELARLVDGLRATRATAVVTGMDFVAVEVIRALQAAGLRVPRDVSVTGFIRTPWAAACHPPLTTVEYPLADLAATLAAVVAGDISAPGTRILVPHLHAGRSTGPVPSPKPAQRAGSTARAAGCPRRPGGRSAVPAAVSPARGAAGLG